MFKENRILLHELFLHFPILGTFHFCNQRKSIVLLLVFMCTRRQQHPEMYETVAKKYRPILLAFHLGHCLLWLGSTLCIIVDLFNSFSVSIFEENSFLTFYCVSERSEQRCRFCYFEAHELYFPWTRPRSGRHWMRPCSLHTNGYATTIVSS